MAGRQRRRLAEAGQVERDHLAVGAQQLDDRVPDAPVGPERMQEQQDRAVSAAVEGERHP
jgi:hypothetical protein